MRTKKVALLIAAALLAGPIAAYADTVNFTLTEEYNNNPQDVITVNGTILGLSQGANIGSNLSIGINTNPSLNYNGLSLGQAQNFLLTDHGSALGSNDILNVSGTQVTVANSTGDSFFTATGSDGTYATLGFVAPGGIAGADLQGVGRCGSNNCNYTLNAGAAGAIQTFSFSNYTVTSPAPLPAAAWLLLSGLGGLGALARKKSTGRSGSPN